MKAEALRGRSVVAGLLAVAASLLLAIGLMSTFDALPTREPVDTSPADPPWPTETGPEPTGATRPPGPSATPPDRSSPGVRPEPTGDRREFLDRQRELLREGEVAYRSPERMRVNDLRRVTVQVGDIGAGVGSGLPGTGRVHRESVLVGTDVRADLSGPDFVITRVGGDDGARVLASGRYAEWAWDVRPLRSGSLYLDLVLYVHVEYGGPPMDVRTFQQPVRVEVNRAFWLGRFLKDYWPLTGITVPVIVAAGWVCVRSVRRRRRRRRTPVGPQAGLRRGRRRAVGRGGAGSRSPG
jgi:hypothetical protein